jgi:acetylornithine deacetylase
VPGETVGDVERELAEIARGAEFRIVASRNPYEASTEDPFVELVQREAGVATVVGALFWTDAALVAAAGIPTVLLGPIGEGAHAEVEWVDLASLDRLHDIVVRVLREWCG